MYVLQTNYIAATLQVPNSLAMRTFLNTHNTFSRQTIKEQVKGLNDKQLSHLLYQTHAFIYVTGVTDVRRV